MLYRLDVQRNIIINIINITYLLLPYLCSTWDEHSEAETIRVLRSSDLCVHKLSHIWRPDHQEKQCNHEQGQLLCPMTTSYNWVLMNVTSFCSVFDVVIILSFVLICRANIPHCYLIQPFLFSCTWMKISRAQMSAKTNSRVSIQLFLFAFSIIGWKCQKFKCKMADSAGFALCIVLQHLLLINRWGQTKCFITDSEEELLAVTKDAQSVQYQQNSANHSTIFTWRGFHWITWIFAIFRPYQHISYTK